MIYYRRSRDKTSAQNHFLIPIWVHTYLYEFTIRHHELFATTYLVDILTEPIIYVLDMKKKTKIYYNMQSSDSHIIKL